MSLAEWIRSIREKGLENTSGRYYSEYAGQVVEDGDPQQQGRVRVWLKQLGFAAAHPNYAYPISPYAGENYGFYFPPHKDEQVLVRFDHGDPNAPRVSGSWWKNPGRNPGARKVAREPEHSHIPAEFRKESELGADGKPKMPSTTARGIKTKGGHGLIFEDQTDAQHVEIWSGRNKPAGEEAERRHRLRLDDTKDNEEIVLVSFGGHKTTWRDKTGEVYVQTTTKDGHELLLDDTGKKILVKTKEGYQILLDDQGQKIEVKTKDGHSLVMSDLIKQVQIKTAQNHTATLDDNTRKIELRTKDLRSITLDDLVKRIVMQNQVGQSVTQDTTGTTVVEPLNATVTAGGVLALNGKGITTTSTGGGPMSVTGSGTGIETFTGPKTNQFLGGLTETIIGLWQAAATAVQIYAASVELGASGGPKYFLVTEEFLTQYLVHTHITTALGAPTSAPITGNIIVPGVTTTAHVKAS